MEASQLTCNNKEAEILRKLIKKGDKAITNILTRCSNPPQGNDD